ncbi:hypothetical protein [Streptomyces fumanus]|uniref:Type I restriction modification DNA specificity domain-containing protein n=1 Tax=Streptomyces fumanus TaxID=67302 RepID=A0A919DXP4_9ACTN|nr:hypothetical protein [Streptomyces fumanus]GHE88471.1 hypothetical protein GCM10018772_10190 [Streptomyces fumanus]
MRDDLATHHIGRSERPEAWTTARLEDLAKDLHVTYGINDRGLPRHQGVVRAGDVRDGRITTDQPGCEGGVMQRTTRATLQRDDLVVVLVRRVGDAALVTEEHEGWVTTRSVGIVRSKERHITRWLRIWLRTRRAQAWIQQHVSAHVEPTLSIDALRKMPVAVPPLERIEKLHELVTLIEDKTRLNLSIAADAVALADAHYATWNRYRTSWPTCEFGRVARASTGRAASSSAPENGVTCNWGAPSDILTTRLPYLDGTERQGLAVPGDICEPGTILIATRPDGMRAAVTLRPVVAGRGVLAVHPGDPENRWWLLHELRLRSRQLSRAAQGRQAREITKRAFSRLDVAWPADDVRREFDRVARPLHQVAQQRVAENASLNETLVTLLSALSPAADRPAGSTGPVLDAGPAARTGVAR